MLEELGQQRAARLFETVLNRLRTAELRAPYRSEGETAFTRGVLAPEVRSLLTELAFPGLLSSGDGAAPVKYAHFLGVPFYPDIAIEYYGTPVIAVEVKLLRGASRQNSIATAIGQASIYKQRYTHSAVMLIDTVPSISNQDASEAGAFTGRELSTPLILRRRAPGETLI